MFRINTPILCDKEVILQSLDNFIENNSFTKTYNTNYVQNLDNQPELKEKDTLDTPPLTFANGICCLITRVASIKSTA